MKYAILISTTSPLWLHSISFTIYAKSLPAKTKSYAILSQKDFYKITYFYFQIVQKRTVPKFFNFGTVSLLINNDELPPVVTHIIIYNRTAVFSLSNLHSCIDTLTFQCCRISHLCNLHFAFKCYSFLFHALCTFL